MSPFLLLIHFALHASATPVNNGVTETSQILAEKEIIFYHEKSKKWNVKTKEKPAEGEIEILKSEAPCISGNGTICATEDCLTIAGYFRGNMDETINPCNDFYKYACGNWAVKNPIPPSKAKWSLMTITKQNVNAKISEILKTDIKSEDITPIKVAKEWYRSCMDIKSIEKRYLTPIIAALKDNGGWPMAMEKGKWDKEKHSWDKIEKYYNELSGHFTFISLDLDNSFTVEKNQIEAAKPKFSLADYILKKMSRNTLYEGDAYKKYIKSVAMAIAQEMDANIDRTELANDVIDIIEFEKQLHNIASIRYSQEDVINDILEFDQSRKDKKFLNKPVILDDEDSDCGSGSGHGNDDGSGNGIDDNEGSGGGSGDHDNDTNDSDDSDDDDLIIIYDDIELLKSIKKFRAIYDKIIKNFIKELPESKELAVSYSLIMPYVQRVATLIEKTPRRILANYIHWHYISEAVVHTTSEMRELHFQVWKDYYGVTEPIPRWEMCIFELGMTQIISYAYVKRHFSEDIRQFATEMIEVVRDEFGDAISNSSWLTEEVKSQAKDKLKSMKVLIGYPSWYDNITAVENYYREFTAGPTYFENVMAFNRYKQLRTLRNLRDGTKPETFYIDPIIINAAYVLQQNTFVIPAADFQSPFFALSQPEAVHFGIIGLIVAHEMSHGFDMRGHVFDKNGWFNPWSSYLELEYIDRSECFMNQFRKYKIEIPETGETLQVKHPERTIDENIADSMGFAAAYRAYLRWIKEKNKPYEQLPGLEKFNSDQLFFLSFANMYCESATPEVIQFLMSADEHSPKYLRVIGAISNSEDFAKAFQCPSNSPMNPPGKCNIWK